MATDHKTLQPLEFYKTFLDRKSRPDGRKLLEFRKMTLNAGSIGTADGSAIVKCGNTTVICGIKAELAAPEREEPSKGFIIPNVTLPSLCSSQIKSGPPGETAQAATQFIAELVNNNIIMDLETLCIKVSKWAWVLHCDLLCINLDGSLLDACVMALVAALKNLKLPIVSYDEEMDKLVSNPDEKMSFDTIKQPVTSTFSLFDNGILISDPTFEEEQLAAGLTSITMEGTSVTHMYKPGGCTLDEKQVKKLIQQSELKTKEVARLIEEACSSSIAER
ncbi:exosome complex component RRP43-like [Daphnia pulicaria]|uniref:exosome complex component RRP43-like n=1 Tax=Daphnia pulicaria TaxID=35523 RepID=UPI001EEAA95E|nr:exosome complex component RRP43-like [Daphnia pulicaria]XP_046655636.1 exosome complex component RRP43-like [Daphnia pulicaria]